MDRISQSGTILFEPVQCHSNYIKSLEANTDSIQEGALYFVIDTQQIYLGKTVDGNKTLLSMGKSSSFIYGKKETDSKNMEPQVIFYYPAEFEEGTNQPQLNDLILNTDGCFYRVMGFDGNGIKTLRLTIAGSGGGGGGSVGGFGSTSVSPVTLVNTPENGILRQGDSCSVQFSFYSSIGGSSTGGYTAEIYINTDPVSDSKAIPQITKKGLPQGVCDPITIPSSVFKTDDTNSIHIRCVDSYGNFRHVTIYRTVLDFYVKIKGEAYNIIKNSNKDSVYSVVCEIGGKAVDRTLTCTCYKMSFGNGNFSTNEKPLKDDDGLIDRVRTIKAGQVEETFNLGSSNINQGKLEYGVYSITLRLNATVNGEELPPAITTYRLINIPTEGTFDKPLLASYIGETSIDQGQFLSIQYGFYSPNASQGSISVTNNGAIVKTYDTIASGAIGSWNFTDYSIGNNLLSIEYNSTVDNTTYKTEQWPVEVKESDLSISMKDGAAIYLSAAGRSNSDKDRDTWTSGKYTTTFENFNWISDGNAGTGWWGDSDGNSMLRLSGNARATINYSPFERDGTSGPTMNGRTIELDFAVRDVNNRSAIPLSCYNGKVGFVVTADKISLRGNTAVDDGSGEEKIFETSVRYNTDERVRVCLVIEPVTDGKKEHLVKIYLNGVLTIGGVYLSSQEIQENGGFIWGGERFEQNSGEDQSVGISIGSNDCNIDVYNIRTYHSALTSKEILQNFIYDTSESVYKKEEMAKNNDIYTVKNGETIVDYDSVKLKNSTMLIIGSLPQAKGEPTQVSVIYNCIFDDELSFEEVYDSETEKKVSLDIQGTSSVAYSRKNYKLKFQNKHLLDKGQIETKVFCIKADYAEGTSTHNTQNANLVHGFYRANTPGKDLNNPLSWQTPPQVEQEDGDKYRTTIYGYPMVLFWKEKEDSEPVFMGKYNFNFDKGSEEVFGFNYDPSDNSGYKAECWEFCHNDLACRFLTPLNFMNSIEDGDWFEDFEPRYFVPYNYIVDPEESSMLAGETITVSYDGEQDDDWYTTIDENGEEVTVKYLNDGIEVLKKNTGRTQRQDELLRIQFNQAIKNFKVMYDWVRETDTNPETLTNETLPEPYIGADNTIYYIDDANYRLAKFKKEFKEHFNYHFCLIYYVYTFFALMVDQRAKNMFLTYWEKDKTWAPWFYDNDTCFGIDNTGEWEFDYFHEDTDTVEGVGKIYNGQDSILWVNFRQAFADDIQATYTALRNEGHITFDKMLERFITAGSDQWSESIYNEDAEFKYISEFINKNDSKWLTQGIKGTGEEHLRYFIENRLDYCDSKWKTADYTGDEITLRIYTPEIWSGVAPSNKITITPFTTMYPGINYASTSIESSEEKVYAGQSYTFDRPGAHFNDTETSIYGASNISSLGDLSPLYLGMISVGNATKLTELNIGSEINGYENRFLKNLSVGANKLLKTLNISNCKALSQNLNLSECPNIETIKAKGSVISGIQFGSAGNLKTLELPGTIKELNLSNQKNLETISIEPGMYLKDCLRNDLISKDEYNTIIKFMLNNQNISNDLNSLNSIFEIQTNDIQVYSSKQYLKTLEEFVVNQNDIISNICYSAIEKIETSKGFESITKININEYFEETDNGFKCLKTAKFLISKTYLTNSIISEDAYQKINQITVNGVDTTLISNYFELKTISANDYYKCLNDIVLYLNIGYNNLTTMKIQNCPKIRTRELLDTIINNNYQKELKVRITGIDWTQDSSWDFDDASYLLRFLDSNSKIKGLVPDTFAATEITINNPYLVGTCRIKSLNGQEYARLRDAFGEKNTQSGLKIEYTGLTSKLNFYIGGQIGEGIDNKYQLTYYKDEIIDENEFSQIIQIQINGNLVDKTDENILTYFSKVGSEYKCKSNVVVVSDLITPIKIAPQQIINSSEKVYGDNPLDPSTSADYRAKREFIRLSSPKFNYEEFEGWAYGPNENPRKDILNKIEGDTNVYAIFKSSRRKHIVSFYSSPNSTSPISEIEVFYGDPILNTPSGFPYPADKPKTDYQHSGWDPKITTTTKVTGPQRYNATYKYTALSNIRLLEKEIVEYTSNTLEQIQDYAFYGCNQLEKVYTPRVGYIGKNAFVGCVKLKEIILLNENIPCELHVDAFKDCAPIINGEAIIYVANSMIEQYKMSAYWINALGEEKIQTQIQPISNYNNTLEVSK